VRKWLRLTRAHTAPLEAVPAVVGALLATNGHVTSGVVIWGIFGILYHLTGYGMNSVTDWVAGYDKNDPNKQHHPLNSGSTSPVVALGVVTALFMATIALAMFQSPTGPTLLLLVVMIVGGFAYNMVGKTLRYVKWLPISIAHTTVFVLPYVASGGDVSSLPFQLSTLAVFIWVVFQIAISGEVKDLSQDEENLLQDMGCTVLGDGYNFTYTAVTLAYSLRVAMWTCAIAATSVVFNNMVASTLASVFALLSVVLTNLMMETGWRSREGRLRCMALIEACSLGVLLSMSIPSIGAYLPTCLFVISAAWVLSLNMVEWGTWVAPRV